MKKYLTLLAVMLIAAIASAQSNYQDVVYLKNGNIIHGIIVEQVPNKSLKIETADKNVFVFQVDEVEKITKEQAAIKQKRQDNSIAYQQKVRSKFIFSEETSFGIDDACTMYGFDAVFGTQFNPYIFLGAGISVHAYDNSEDYDYDYYDNYGPDLSVPLYVNFKYTIIKTRATPYIDVRLGYGIANDFTYYGSAMFGVRIGLGSSRRVGLNASLGLSTEEWEYENRHNTYSDTYLGFGIRLGVDF